MRPNPARIALKARDGLPDKPSQRKFGRLFGIPRHTIEAWEQGKTVPSGAAFTLLQLVQKYPTEMIRMVSRLKKK